MLKRFYCWLVKGHDKLKKRTIKRSIIEDGEGFETIVAYHWKCANCPACGISEIDIWGDE